MTFSNPPTFLPPVLATGQGASSNGRQQLGSGLVTHRGIIDANCFRAQGALSPQSGAGLELAYTQSPKAGYVQSYDRDALQYTDLVLSGKNVTLTPQGGKVSLPAGTAQGHVVSYQAALSWPTPAGGTWYETPAGGTFTSTNVECRIEASATVSCSLVGALAYLGWGYDGAVQSTGVAAHCPAANYLMAMSFITYVTLPAGNRRIALFLLANSGIATIWNGSVTHFNVTEQRA